MRETATKKARRAYRVKEFAELTGVTVRTLHHYDRLGLLQPGGRTAAGYRLYGERDFARLQQIVTLKFLGFSLHQIKEVLGNGSSGLARLLRLQRETLAGRRAQLDLAVRAIENVERVLTAADEPDWEAFKQIIEVINMQNDRDWMKKYYSQEARDLIEERAGTWTPELQARAEADWTALYADVEQAIADGEDPAGARAQALVERWSALVGAFTGGNQAITEGLDNLYADRDNWSSELKQTVNPDDRFSNPEVMSFIQKAQAAGRA